MNETQLAEVDVDPETGTIVATFVSITADRAVRVKIIETGHRQFFCKRRETVEPGSDAPAEWKVNTLPHNGGRNWPKVIGLNAGETLDTDTGVVTSDQGGPVTASAPTSG